jgi:hypothetical protein
MWKMLAPVLTGICLSLAAPAPVADKPKVDDAFVIALDRSGGFVAPDSPITHYRFTMAKDGSWEFKPQAGEPKRGKISIEDLNKWVKQIEDGGLYTVKSNPELGANDSPFMDITVQTTDKKTRVKIPLEEKLSQAIEKKIIELTERGK